MSSLKHRYFYKLASTVLGIGSGLLNYVFVSHALGPAKLGTYNYLVNFFESIISLFDSGSLNCVYTKVSRRENTVKWTTLYILYCLICVVVLGVITAVALVAGAGGMVWPGQYWGWVVLGLMVSVMLLGMKVLSQLNDAYALTVHAERVKMIQNVGAMLVLAALFFSGYLELWAYFLFNILNVLILAARWHAIYREQGMVLVDTSWLNRPEVSVMLSELYRYVKPLFIFSLISAAIDLSEKWMLLYFSGSAEQGFFWFSFRLRQMCILFATAFLPILLREYSIAHQANDEKRIKDLAEEYMPLFMFISAFIALYIAASADTLVVLAGGSQFENAIIVTRIMMFEILLIPLNQFTATIYYASGATVVYSRIGIFIGVLGFIVAFFMLAPPHLMGLELGAVGLAVKSLIMNIIATNMFLLFIAGRYNIDPWRIIGAQLTLTLILFALASVSVGLVVRLGGSPTAALIEGGIVYAVLTGGAAYAAPGLFGLRKDNIRRYIGALNFTKVFKK